MIQIGVNPIHLFRRLRDLTQEQLAESTDLTTNYIGLLEIGSRGPSFEVLEKLAIALNVDASELFQFDDTPPKRRRQKEG